MSILESLTDFLWEPWLLGLFLLVGLWFSFRTGFFQIFQFKTWWNSSIGTLFHRKNRKQRGISQLQALSTALAATIGTGSIAGVATAIFFGGPGAVFWMWVCAILGMMTSCAEKTLAVRYRRATPNGWVGGPMCYIEDGLHMPWLAKLFSAALILQTLTGGTMVQANSIATALHASFGWNKLAVGLLCALLAAAVVLGGIQRIGRVSELLVPAMALLFVGGGAVVLFRNLSAIPEALLSIFRCAFQPKSMLGGYSMATAIRFGVARGVFTNEAGMGSSAVAHAAAQVDEPAQQGMWGIFEVFLATLVVCSVTALVILTSGVYSASSALTAIRSGSIPDAMTGAPLTAASFEAALGPIGPWLVSLCLILFAFTSLLGAGFYGHRGVESLGGGHKAQTIFRFVFLSAIALGSVGELTSVWQLTDLCNALLALPNLLALLLLSKEAISLIRSYRAPSH